jgi:serine/threonine-protein kinase
MKALTRDKAKRFATGRELAKAIEAAMGPEIFDEEQMAGLMAEYFSDKIQKTRALLEYASRDDARLSEAAGALQDDPGDSTPTAQVKRTPKPRSAPGAGASGRPGSGPRPRKPASNPAQTAVPATPRGARPRVAARQEAQEPPEPEDEEIPPTQPVQSARVPRPGARSSASVGAARPAASTPEAKGEEKSKWGSRLFLLAFFGAIGGLLYLEPVRAMLRPGYESAVAWVKNELELSPPPPPPDTQTWPPPQKQRPPNPLVPEETPAPTPPETAATAEPAKPEPLPENPHAPVNLSRALRERCEWFYAASTRCTNQVDR